MSAIPDIAWSRSRRRTWNACPRRYRYRYHGEDPQLEALRNLMSPHEWAVRLVYDVIDEAVAYAGTGRHLEVGELRARADRRLTAQWADFRAAAPGITAQINQPHDPALHDIPGRVRKQVREWLTRFAGSSVLAQLLAAPPACRRPPARNLFFEAAGIPVAAPPMWGRLDADDGLVLCAWSATQRPPADGAQWAVAALFACQQTGIAPDRIRVHAAHLASDAVDQYFAIDAGMLIEEQNRIIEDAVRWRAALRQGEAGFPAQPDAGRCLECPFLHQCPEGTACQ